MKNLFFSERCESIQSPFEVLWTGIVLIACKKFMQDEEKDDEKFEKKRVPVPLTPAYETKDGEVIPPHYHRGILLNGSIVNFFAFTDEAVHGNGGDNDYLVARCYVEQKSIRQKVLDPVLNALERSQQPGLKVSERQSWIILALRILKEIAERYPRVRVGEEGTPRAMIQERMADFINPNFGQPGQAFMTDEQLSFWRQSPADEAAWHAEFLAFVEAFRAKAETLEFDQEYNPIRLEGVTREEFVEALRRRELYKLAIEGQLLDFTDRQEKSVFSVIQRKRFALEFRRTATDEAVKMEELSSYSVQCGVAISIQPSSLMIASKFVSPREIDELLTAYAPAATPPVAFAPSAPATSDSSDKSADSRG